MTVSSKQETPVVFSAGGEDLVGIFTRPAGDANGVAVISLWGGGGVPPFGKNQARVRLSRELAARGFHVLRFSYPGVAESGGTLRDVMQKPSAEDAVGAVQWLKAQGFEQIIMIGLCAGGRAALAAATRVEGLLGLALISSPVGEGGHRDAVLEQPMSWYLRRAASPRSLLLLVANGKASRRRKILRLKARRLLLGAGHRTPSGDAARQVFLPQVRAALDAGTAIHFLYGSDDDFYAGFEQARRGALGRVIEERKDLATVEVAAARFEGLASLASQEIFLQTMISWTSGLAGGGGGGRKDGWPEGANGLVSQPTGRSTA
jgi:pimeloyl-ACP methyl ester carboxylesterase